MFGLGHIELLIVGVVMLLLFGHRLPGMARSMGVSLRVFKDSVNGKLDDDQPASERN